MAADEWPEIAEKPDRNGRTAQRVTPPVVVNGVIAKPGETDLWLFEGRAGLRLVAEVWARRLGSPLDALLTLRRASGKNTDVIAMNDDQEDRAFGRLTHHADPRIEIELPADGLYELRVSDTQGAAGPAYAYRLRIAEPRPDFEVRLTPSSVSPRRGTGATVTAHLLRRDGFDGEVRLRIKNAPAGISLGAAKVPAGQDKGKIEIRAAREAPPGPTWLEFEAEAEIGGERVVRAVLPAEDMEQAFAWRFLVPVESFLVWMAPRPPPPAAARAAD